MTAPDSTVFAVLDALVAVEGPTDLLDALAHHLGAPSRAAANAWLRVEPDGTARGSDGVLGGPGPALASALIALNAIALARCRGLALHAGVVADGARALALPGVSGTGKSTLVAACLQRGLTYVSDEALVLDRSTGAVRPYPRPLGLAPWTVRHLGLAVPVTLPEAHVPPASLTSRVAEGRLALAHVVVPVRASEPPSLAPVHRASAAQVLLQRAFNHFEDPVGSLGLVVDAVRAAECWQLDYDDPVSGAELLVGLLSG